MPAIADMRKLELSALCVEAGQGRDRLPVLDNVSFSARAGAQIGIFGPSGSGKTTLLFAIAGLAPITSGTIVHGGAELTALSENGREAWRRKTIGLVFQNFHLVPELSVEANILLPAQFDCWCPSAALRERARMLANDVGITRLNVQAGLLSRGEQQRVAVARALLNAPEILLADEPTASLDKNNAAQIADLLATQCRQARAMLIVASHDERLLAGMDRTVEMQAGRMVSAGALP